MVPLAFPQRRRRLILWQNVPKQDPVGLRSVLDAIHRLGAVGLGSQIEILEVLGAVFVTPERDPGSHRPGLVHVELDGAVSKRNPNGSGVSGQRLLRAITRLQFQGIKSIVLQKLHIARCLPMVRSHRNFDRFGPPCAGG